MFVDTIARIACVKFWFPISTTFLKLWRWVKIHLKKAIIFYTVSKYTSWNYHNFTTKIDIYVKRF